MNTTEVIHHVVKIITLVYFHSATRLLQQDYFVLGEMQAHDEDDIYLCVSVSRS